MNYKRLSFLLLLLLPGLCYSIGKEWPFINKCNQIQSLAYELHDYRDHKKQLSFCRFQSIHMINDINAVCSALHEDRLAYAKNMTGVSINRIDLLKGAGCRSKNKITELEQELTHLLNLIDSIICLKHKKRFKKIFH